MWSSRRTLWLQRMKENRKVAWMSLPWSVAVRTLFAAPKAVNLQQNDQEHKSSDIVPGILGIPVWRDVPSTHTV